MTVEYESQSGTSKHYCFPQMMMMMIIKIIKNEEKRKRKKTTRFS